MRAAFIRTLVELAKNDPRILLLTGDMGYMVIEPFVEQFPTRFINVGVAEQNMIGTANGLAEAGFIPFVYSITPFAVLRPFEMIRNGPVYHQFPVRIVGIGQGVEYGINGHSHYALEDVGVLRTQPSLNIIAPADDAQAASALQKTWDMPGPVYYRLSKETVNIPALDGTFELGRAQTIRDGKDALIISSGAITGSAIRAAQLLEAQGVQCAIVVVASIAPPPIADLVGALARFSNVFTVEAHYTSGGVGSLIAEIIAENGIATRLTRFGFETIQSQAVGSTAYLEAANGLSPEQIAERIKQAISPHRRR